MQPVKDDMPGLASKGAGQEQVLNSLHGLVAMKASRVMLQSASHKPFSSPAAILGGQPMEEFNPWWHPALPDQLPGRAMCGSLKTGRITRARRVYAVGSPPPEQAIRLARQGGVTHCLPKQQVLADLMQAQDPLYIIHPRVTCHPICHRPDFVSSFGNALVEQRGDLTDGLPINPAIFPKQRRQAIPNDHGSGGEE